jgi:hypothetical protein
MSAGFSDQLFKTRHFRFVVILQSRILGAPSQALISHAE